MCEFAKFLKQVRVLFKPTLYWKFCSWSCMFVAFSTISITLLTTAIYSWGQRWQGNFESLIESLFLQPAVPFSLAQFKAFHTWAFWGALRRTYFILNQPYYHSVWFYQAITFILLSSSVSLLYQFCFLCYTGELYSTWDKNIYDLLSFWSEGGWRKGLPPHWSVNQGCLPADTSSLEIFDPYCTSPLPPELADAYEQSENSRLKNENSPIDHGVNPNPGPHSSVKWWKDPVESPSRSVKPQDCGGLVIVIILAIIWGFGGN